MEELVEKRVWQRVRGEQDPAGELRTLLTEQGRCLGAYGAMSRRGGAWRRLYECKEEQVACLRGLLRMLTGQGAAHPRPGSGGIDLAACMESERQTLETLTELSREGRWSAVLAHLCRRQERICCLLLELLGRMA